MGAPTTLTAMEASTETKGIGRNPFAYNLLARIFIIEVLVPFVMSIVIRMKDNDEKERELQIVKKSTKIGVLYIVGVVVFLLLVLPLPAFYANSG
jgi:hypothetical protein